MENLRIVHFMNQFFGGIGGEEMAHVPPQSGKGPIGPGAVLQEVLGKQGQVVGNGNLWR